MSYILDALKKAERERGAAQVPTLMTVHDSPRESSSTRFWILSACALLFASALVWLIISLTIDKPSGRPAASLSEVHIKQTEPASETIPASAPSVESPKPVVPSGNQAFQEAPVIAKPPSTRIPQVELQSKLSAQDTSRIAIPKAPAPENPISDSRSVYPQVNPKASAEAQESDVRPASLREAMAGMNITILSYADEQSDRIVFINDRKYVEGDYVDGRYLVESITMEGVVLNYQGERATLRPKAE